MLSPFILKGVKYLSDDSILLEINEKLENIEETGVEIKEHGEDAVVLQVKR